MMQRSQVELHRGDANGRKQYAPAMRHMRHLIDTYIRAVESEKVSEIDGLSTRAKSTVRWRL